MTTNTKKRMLITDTAPLYPPLWGGPKRIWNLYSNFSGDLFDVTYVGVSFNLRMDEKYSFNKIYNNFKEILCTVPLHYYPWHTFERMAFKNTSLDLFVYLFMHTDWHFRYVLNSQKADILICSHPWSSLSINKRNSQLFIYDAHNCEYFLMDKILGNHAFKNKVLRQVKRIEEDACKKSDLILACSEKEKEDFMNLYNVNADKIIIIPNGSNINGKIDEAAKADYRKTLSILPDEKIIIFIGAYYKPNIDAVSFIIENIAPKLEEYRFFIVGAASEHFKTKQIPSNLRLFGRISDEQLNAVLNASDIAINPIFDGSGVNIKMLDYMAYGLPVVTTECGARGIEVFERMPMIISSKEDFIRNIKTLINDKQLYEQMSDDGRQLIIQYYNWKSISKDLEGILLERLKYN